MINFLIVTHGEFGAYAVEAAEGIVGEQRRGVRSVSVSHRMSFEAARAQVAAAIDDLCGPEGLVILTDIPGGTPSNLCLPLVQGRTRVAVLSGLNLYMLVTGFSKRDLPFDELVPLILGNGSRSLADLGKLLNKARLKTQV